MKYADEVTLEKLLGLSDDLRESVMDVQDNLNKSIGLYIMIPHSGYGHDPEEVVVQAAEATTDFLNSVQEMDRLIAEMLAQRGRLAEETGIPMFSHINAGKTWTRFDTYGL